MKTQMTYIGKRLNGEKLCAAFLHEGKEVFFSHIKFVSIGSIYEAEKKDGGLQAARCPEYIGHSKESEEVQEKWRVEEMEAKEFIRRKRDAVSSSQSRLVKTIANILRPHADTLSYQQFEAIMKRALDDARKERRERETREMNARWKKIIKRQAVKDKKEKKEKVTA